MGTKFLIVDPSLKDMRGHHYSLSQRISLSAYNSGFSTIIACNKSAINFNIAHAKIHKALSTDMYAAYQTANNGKTNKIKLILFKMFFSALKKAGRPISKDRTYSRQLNTICKQLNIQSDDRLLFHTSDGLTYSAIDYFVESINPKNIPVIHICTPYDPEGVMPNKVAGRSIDSLISKWENNKWLNNKIFLHAENQCLANHLSTTWNSKVHSLPLPSPTTSLPEREPHRPVNIVYLGPARTEKGFDLIPDIIRNTVLLFRSHGINIDSQISFTIQCTAQIIGYSPTILQTIEKLRTYPNKLVTLIEPVLSEEGYLNLLNSADIVLLPYRVEEYKYRSSGIVSEALCMNKILLSTNNTYPSSMIKENTGKSASNPFEFAEAIKYILDNIDFYRDGAISEGSRYRRKYCVEKYIPRLIKSETQPHQ